MTSPGAQVPPGGSGATLNQSGSLLDKKLPPGGTATLNAGGAAPAGTLPKKLPPGGHATLNGAGSGSPGGAGGGTGSGTGAGGSTPPPGDVSGAGIDDSGYTAIIQSTLAIYGLQSLVPQVVAWGKTGASTDQISLQLQQTPEWKTRFAGNEERVKNGLAPLDPTTYIGLESQYRQILNDLPAGFYDSKADIDHFIGANQSPAELSNKVHMADQIVMAGANSGPSELQQAYQQYYGVVGKGGIIASILDPTKAEPLIEQQFAAAQIGGAALSQGLGLTKNTTAIKAAQQGVTLQQAQNAFTAIKGRIATDTAASARFANAATTPVTQDLEEQAGLLGDAKAQRTQQLLGSEEAGLFGGHGGSSTAANSPGLNV